MWSVKGRKTDIGQFQPFEPIEVLYDFDGPRTFTFKDRDGQLCLGHWCDEDQNLARFLVAEFSEQLTWLLKKGELSLLEAIDQPRIWVLDVAHSGNVVSAFLVKLSDLPADVLPRPGTMLLPSLEPLLGLRSAGDSRPK